MVILIKHYKLIYILAQLVKCFFLLTSCRHKQCECVFLCKLTSSDTIDHTFYKYKYNAHHEEQHWEKMTDFLLQQSDKC